MSALAGRDTGRVLLFIVSDPWHRSSTRSSALLAELTRRSRRATVVINPLTCRELMLICDHQACSAGRGGHLQARHFQTQDALLAARRLQTQRAAGVLNTETRK